MPGSSRQLSIEGGLPGRVAVITGAAKGMGGAISEALAGDGAHTVLAGRDVDALEELAGKLDASFPERRSLAVRCDVTDVDQVDGLVRAAVETFGGVDILVNAAGVIGPMRPPRTTSRPRSSGRSSRSTWSARSCRVEPPSP